MPDRSDSDKDSPPKIGTKDNIRSACTECQRRKQKCNREWPCNHCQKRRVAEKCQFKDNTVVAPEKPLQNIGKKRGREVENGDTNDDYAEDVDAEVDVQDVEGFEALGYAHSHLFNAGLTSDLERKSKPIQKTYLADPESCPQLERALHTLPPRPYTDAIVQNFLNSVNYHYYIIYPTSFLNDYEAWWNDRNAQRPLGVQWTCLLMMICACSVQYTSPELEPKLAELTEDTQKLCERYHNVARELHNVIPVGHNHTYNVQSLLHSCYWYKSEARFVECWHVLSSAIREAQELGFDKETAVGPIPELEREIRRRIWCVLDTWDWQISALLTRPMIIDRSDCDVGLPTLTLEGYTPSPLLHMKLQSELIGKLAARFGLPKNVVEPKDVQEYQGVLEGWMRDFPPTYNIQRSDTSSDEERPWIKLHRHYIHTMSFSMLLDPIRAYLAKEMDASSPPIELKIRKDGVNYALKLMGALYGFFDHVWPRDAKFHFVIFCIFDTAAVLTSIILHDKTGSIPRRDEIVAAIGGALRMITQLIKPLPAAKLYHSILTRLQRKVHKKLGLLEPNDARRKRTKPAEVTASCVGEASPPREVPAAEEIPYKPSASFYTDPSAFVTAGPQYAPVTPPLMADPGLILPTAGNPSLFEGAYSYDQFPAVQHDQFTAIQPFPVDSSFIFAAPSNQNNMYLTDELPSTGYQVTPPIGEQAQDWGFSQMTAAELGELGDLWRWQSLDLDLVAPPGQVQQQPPHTQSM